MKSFAIYGLVVLNGIPISRAVKLEAQSKSEARKKFSDDFPGYQIHHVEVDEAQGRQRHEDRDAPHLEVVLAAAG
jgi:hypothetical protein